MKNIILVFVLFIHAAVGCQKKNTSPISPKVHISLFAESKNQWTGIAISKNNRVFVNFPRWSADTPVSVAEIINGKTIPFPDAAWNRWNENADSKNQFICVQSVYIDELDQLWILDTGYDLKTDVTKGAFLYCFDLRNNNLKVKYTLSVEKISPKAYLNDFRIDNQNHSVYFTDSQVGGIVVLDMITADVRRVLSNHHSTLAETDKIVIEGYERKHPVHSDGIAIDPDKKHLYYCALMGKNIYRIPISSLLNKNLSDDSLQATVEKYAESTANDGIIFDKKGNLYLSSLEKNAISRIDKNRILSEIISDPEIKWPDSFAFDKAGNLYFTISQIHLPKEKRTKYKIFRLKFYNKIE